MAHATVVRFTPALAAIRRLRDTDNRAVTATAFAYWKTWTETEPMHAAAGAGFRLERNTVGDETIAVAATSIELAGCCAEYNKHGLHSREELTKDHESVR
jgi:hypothetical protein